jgi:hypothetical protein
MIRRSFVNFNPYFIEGIANSGENAFAQTRFNGTSRHSTIGHQSHPQLDQEGQRSQNIS